MSRVETVVVKRFSEALKLKVVAEVESGILTVREAQEEYGISAKNSVYKWLRRYGKHHRQTKIVRVVMKDEKEKIRELERALADEVLRNRVLETEVQILEEDFGGPEGVKKKLGTERWKELEALKAKYKSLK